MIDRARLEALEVLMSAGEIERLCELASEVPRTQEIVEVGSYTGGSAAWMTTACRAHITCIDAWADLDWNGASMVGEDVLAKFLKVVDWTAVTALRGRSVDVAQMWLKPIGLLFIDANHDYGEVRADYEAWHRHIVPGGWIVFHDYPWTPEDVSFRSEGPGRVVDEIVWPSGLWEECHLVDCLWSARRKAA